MTTKYICFVCGSSKCITNTLDVCIPNTYDKLWECVVCLNKVPHEKIKITLEELFKLSKENYELVLQGTKSLIGIYTELQQEQKRIRKEQAVFVDSFINKLLEGN